MSVANAKETVSSHGNVTSKRNSNNSNPKPDAKSKKSQHKGAQSVKSNPSISNEKKTRVPRPKTPILNTQISNNQKVQASKAIQSNDVSTKTVGGKKVVVVTFTPKSGQDKRANKGPKRETKNLKREVVEVFGATTTEAELEPVKEIKNKDKGARNNGPKRPKLNLEQIEKNNIQRDMASANNNKNLEVSNERLSVHKVLNKYQRHFKDDVEDGEVDRVDDLRKSPQTTSNQKTDTESDERSIDYSFEP